MAFNRKNLSGGIGAGSNAPKLFTFVDSASTKAQVATADYFLTVTEILNAGDIILCGCSDGTTVAVVASATATTVTTEALETIGGVSGSFVSDAAASTITVTNGIITAIV